MPQFSQNSSGGKIVWSSPDWLGGLNPQYNTSLTTVPAPIVGDGMASASCLNPFRYLGYASPGFAATDVGVVSSVTAAIRNGAFGVEGSTNYLYCISDGTKIQRLDVSGKSVANAGSWPHVISTGAIGNVTGNDIVAYNITIATVSTPTILYSWNDDGGAWNVGEFIPSTGTFTDNFLTASGSFSPASTGATKPHPLFVGADDLLYIGDGNLLHSYEGTTGTAYTAVLTLPAGYVITSFARTTVPSKYLVVFAYYSPSGQSVTPDPTTSGPSKAFFWDYLSQDPTYDYDLNDSAVAVGFSYQGTVGCVTVGKNLAGDGENRNCRLKLFDGTKFDTQLEFIGNPPIHGGIEVVGNAIQWNSDGIVHSWGSPFAAVKAGLNKIAIGATTGQSGQTNCRMLKTIGGISGYQTISTGTTTAGGLQYLASGTFETTASVVAPTAAPTFPDGTMGQVRSVKVNYGKTSSGGRAFSLSLLYEGSQTTTLISSQTAVTSTDLVTRFTSDTSGQPGSLPKFIEIRPVLEWAAGSGSSDAPVVRSIELEYELINIIST